MTLTQTARAPSPGPRRFTRAEYYQMAELGFFESQRVELIDGEIIRMSPQNNPHGLAISLIDAFLHRALPGEFTIRCQLPLVVSEETEPEPDFAVVAGSPESQREHPRTALLIIEVADSTLKHDREKANVYASVQVPEYWIVNLAKRRLEVYRHPIADEEAKHGFKYREVLTLEEQQNVKAAQLPLPEVKVGRLLPGV